MTHRIISKSISTHIHTCGKYHRRIVHCTTHHPHLSKLRSKVIEDIASHQSELCHLRKNNSETGEVTTNESIFTIKLAPTSHPEEEVQQLRDEHSKHEVGSEGFNFAGLFVIIITSSYTVLLEHMKLRKNRNTLQIHRDRPGDIYPSLATALGVNNL